VSAHIASLKWSQPKYAEELKQRMNSNLDYKNRPAEDYAHAIVTFVDRNQQHLIGE
jgi:hypothetical protein